jgi:hypothetical protein
VRDALQKELGEPVAIAMRYGNPSPKAAFDELSEKYPGLEEVIAVPMYPHYAMSSYETAVEYAKEQHAKGGYSFSLTMIKPFFDRPEFIHALSESLRPHLDGEWDQVLFSYHGIPERHILKSDVTGSHCLKVGGLLRQSLACPRLLLPSPVLENHEARYFNTRHSRRQMGVFVSVASRPRPLAAAVHGKAARSASCQRHQKTAGSLPGLRQRLPGNAGGNGGRRERDLSACRRRALCTGSLPEQPSVMDQSPGGMGARYFSRQQGNGFRGKGF